MELRPLRRRAAQAVGVLVTAIGLTFSCMGGCLVLGHDVELNPGLLAVPSISAFITWLGYRLVLWGLRDPDDEPR